MAQGHCATAGPRPCILSFDHQKKIHQLRFQAWREDPENRDKVKTVEREENFRQREPWISPSDQWPDGGSSG